MSDRMLALLLRLYPRHFRVRYAPEMEEVFRMQLEARRARGGPAVAALRLRTALGMITGAAAEWRGVAGHGVPGGGGPGGVQVGGGGGLFGLLEGVATDVRLALRGLVRQPVFAVAAIGTLGLGIGGVTTMWSVVHGVLLKPLPYPDADRLVRVFVDNTGFVQPPASLTFTPSQESLRHSPPQHLHYLALLEQSHTVEDAATLRLGFRGAEMDSGSSLRLNVGSVSWNLLSLLGAEPALGRDFLPHENEPGRDPVVILSHDFWHSVFGGDPAALGRTLHLNGDDNSSRERGSYVVVGVAPADFRFLFDRWGQGANRVGQYGPPPPPVDLWIPTEMFPRAGGQFAVSVIAKLREGYSPIQAEAEIGAILAPMEMQVQPGGPREGATGRDLATVVPLYDTLFDPVRGRLNLSLAATALVLLLASINVANLLLSRAPARRPEFATRAALGAGRVRLIRQLATEALVLSCLAAALGALLAGWGVQAIVALGPPEIPRLSEVRADIAVLAVCGGLALLCTILVGLVPALRGSLSAHAGHRGPAGAGGRSFLQGSSRGALIAGQLAVALVLTASAGLLVRSVSRLAVLDLGVRTEGVVATRLMLPADDPNVPREQQHTQWARFAYDLIERLEADPAVAAAALAINAPPLLEGARSAASDSVLGSLAYNAVTEKYFDVLGMDLLRGRGFSSSDDWSATHVRIVSENYVARVYPTQESLGKVERARMVVGVVRDHMSAEYSGEQAAVRYVRAAAETRTPQLYVPLAQHRSAGSGSPGNPGLSGGGEVWALMRTAGHVRMGTSTELYSRIRAAVAAVDPRAVVYDIQTLDAAVDRVLAVPRFHALLASLFGFLAAAIAAAGVFGVLAFLVSQRTHEIGVRMALGAEARDVVSLVVRQVAAVAVVGLALGVLGALAAGRLLESWLFEIEPTDPVSLAGAAALLLTAAVVAAWLPVRRAASIDPAKTLKGD